MPNISIRLLTRLLFLFFLCSVAVATELPAVSWVAIIAIYPLVVLMTS